MNDFDKISYIFHAFAKLHRMLYDTANRNLKKRSKHLMRDISGGQIHLLVTLDRLCQKMPEGVSLGVLSEELSVTPASCSGMVDRLVKKGLIERKPDGDDRRKVRLYLSEKMSVEFEAIHDQMMEGAVELLNRLDTEILDRWYSLMVEIAVKIE